MIKIPLYKKYQNCLLYDKPEYEMQFQLEEYLSHLH